MSDGRLSCVLVDEVWTLSTVYRAIYYQGSIAIADVADPHLRDAMFDDSTFKPYVEHSLAELDAGNICVTIPVQDRNIRITLRCKDPLARAHQRIDDLECIVRKLMDTK